MDIREWQRRVSIVITLSGLILLSFVGRLYQKAVIEHGSIVKAAELQYTSRKEVVGKRGEILTKLDSKNYFPLATNERRYQVLVVPKNIKDHDKAAQALAPILEQSAHDINAKIDNDKVYIPPLKRRLTRLQADKIAALRLDGVLLLPEFVRVYPENNLASQALGFVNNDWQGNYGVEDSYNNVLKGSEGVEVSQRDNTGRLIKSGEEVAAKNGSSVVLTLDREIQHAVEKSLADALKKYEADTASAIVLDPKTGAILSMAALPNFDPNAFYDVPQDQVSVFNNPVTSYAWEPGSIMKPIVMALAMQEHLVEPDTKDTFSASVKVLNYEIFTAEKKAFGLETMTQVLENSDNVAMVWVSNKLGNQKEYDGLKRFGFGVIPSLKLPSVTSGFLPALKDWNDVTRATASFGQGVSATPLQMVTAYATLANKGVMMQPYLVDRVIDDEGATIFQAQPKSLGKIIDPDTSNKIGTMLQSVVENGHGKRAAVSGYRVGGKTGTAQVSKPDGGYYDDRHIGSFAGYFPLSDPRYVMLVKLDNPKNVQFAESSAAPTFGEIAQFILTSKAVSPDKPGVHP